MDDGPMLWQLILQLVLIMLNAVFACAEIAVISMNDNKLAKLSATGDKRAIKLSALVGEPSKFLATIQVGITLAGFMGSAFAADNFSDRLVNWVVGMGVTIPEKTLDAIAVVIVTLILSYFTLILGELVPKRIAMRRAEQLALKMSGMIYFISKLFAPIVFALTASTNGVLRLFGIDPNEQEEETTEEEIRMMVDAGSEQGTINLEEKEMIQNVFEFDDITANEVMTHRTEVSILWMEETVEQWDQTINESRHSIYPVCNESVDDIVGTLNVKDYFRIKDKTRENIIKVFKEPYFVPETVCADVLFRNMKETRRHFAVVLDEYAGMSGVITMNDLLEQIVGDLEDDTKAPKEPPFIERIDSQTWKILGTAPLEMLTEHLGIDLPEDDYDTFAGLVFGLLGTIPNDGTTPEVNGLGLVIKVNEIKEHRLISATVCLEKKLEDNSEK